MFRPVRYPGIFSVAALLLVGGCTTINKNTEKEAADTNNLYRTGSVQGALQSLETSFNKGSLIGSNEDAKKDTIYYLEKGTFLSNLGQSKLGESTKNFLVAKNTVVDWENQTSLSFNMSAKEMMESVSTSMTISRFYIPRDYEKTFIGYELMVNHALAKRYDLAFPEAKYTIELDEALTKARKEELDEANAKAKEQIASSGVTGSITRINQIQGYPIDTFNTKEVLALKNSYLNAGTYYLNGFVSEAMGEATASLAAPSYQKALSINPAPFFKQGLDNFGRKVKPGAKQSDTLIIVETGFLSDIYSFKATIPFATRSGPKAVTWVIPAVRNNAQIFNPVKVDANGRALPLTLVSNVEAMSRRELKDQMPSYIAKAVVSSIIQITAQELSAKVIDNKVKDQNANMLLKLGSSVAVNVLAAGDVDTRMWKSLPSGVYMTRAILSQGDGTLSVQTPSGPKQVKVSLNSPYEVVRVRVFDNGVVATTFPRPLNEAEYGKLVSDDTSAIK